MHPYKKQHLFTIIEVQDGKRFPGTVYFTIFNLLIVFIKLLTGMLYFKMDDKDKAVAACQQCHKMASMFGPHSLQVKCTKCTRMALGALKVLQ